MFTKCDFLIFNYKNDNVLLQRLLNLLPDNKTMCLNTPFFYCELLAHLELLRMKWSINQLGGED